VKATMHAVLAHMCGAMIVAASHADEPSIPRIGVVHRSWPMGVVQIADGRHRNRP
jgi:hypothetical protein